MCHPHAAVKRLHWGLSPQAGTGHLASALSATSRTAAATVPVVGLAWIAASVATWVAPGLAIAEPPRPPPAITVPPAQFAPSWDLDGTYLWLGPLGAASHIDARWDSTFGAEAALVIVRERAPLSLGGIDLGASRWSARGGGRVWVDGVAGTHLLGHMMGLSLGPIVELSDLAHPRPGASIGVWGFTGIAPFARIGAVAQLGMFMEFGVHIALPVLRR